MTDTPESAFLWIPGCFKFLYSFCPTNVWRVSSLFFLVVAFVLFLFVPLLHLAFSPSAAYGSGSSAAALPLFPVMNDQQDRTDGNQHQQNKEHNKDRDKEGAFYDLPNRLRSAAGGVSSAALVSPVVAPRLSRVRSLGSPATRFRSCASLSRRCFRLAECRRPLCFESLRLSASPQRPRPVPLSPDVASVPALPSG